MQRVAAFAVCLALAGCGGIERGPDREAWGRLDGRPISADPALSSKFERDSTGCRAEAARTLDPSSDPAAAKAAVVAKAQDCMRRRGYALQHLPGGAVVDTPYGPVVAPGAYGPRRQAAG